MQFRCGKLPAHVPPGTPRLGASLIPAWTPPVAVDWTKRVTAWPLLRNDVLSDCVPAGALHLVQAWRANAWGADWQPRDEDAVALYKTWAGYDGTQRADRGTVMSAAMAAWGIRGTVLSGAETVPWSAHVSPGDVLALKAAISELGGALGGLLLPTAAFDPGDWEIPPAGLGSPEGMRGGAGGHCVALVGYDAAGLVCVTWGALRRMSWAFWLAYADEAWLVLSRTDWLDARDDRSPSALDWTQLEADARKLGAV